jgi:dihydropteroate synthase
MAVNGRADLAAPGPPALLAAVGRASEADRAITEGADLIDVTGMTADAAAAAGERVTPARLWTGSPAAVDADGVAGDADSLAAIVAAAALSTWLGAPVIRTRHVAPVRRAIDMTLSIAGRRLPALTTRGLA